MSKGGYLINGGYWLGFETERDRHREDRDPRLNDNTIAPKEKQDPDRGGSTYPGARDDQYPEK